MQKFLSKHNINATTIAVGVSGGSDSLSLVLMAAEQLKVFGYNIIALTVNHKLRKEANAEADYVAKVMKNFHIEHHILEWNGDKPETGIEEAARIARYELVLKWCRENNVKYFMTAHHLRDQAETFLMRLQRGSGLDGLCCMRECSKYKDLTILRPLLHTSPSYLEQYLLQKNIAWVHDCTNNDTNFLRVKMRKFLPELEQKTQINLAKFDEAISNLQSAESFVEEYIYQVALPKVHTDAYGIISIKYTDFAAWHKEIKFRIFADLCRKTYIPRADSVLKLVDALEHLPFYGSTLGGKEIFTAYGKIWIVPEVRAKRKQSRKMWQNFILFHQEYKELKIPHKAKVFILENSRDL